MRSILTFLFTLILSINIYSQRDVETLVDYMVGSFSSKEQAEKDSSYFNIEIEMVQIWEDRTDGPWIYIEQAASETKDQPYRQRVYQIKQRSDGKIESIVYSIPNPLRFAGDYKKEFPLLRLTPDSLLIKAGCDVVLHRTDDGYFEGGSIDKNCKSDLRGASYATSEVMIDKDKMLTWDRGFDENGNQVWGATKGGYVFIKKINRFQKR
ncbi:MAG: chromophore lyase CpcT/CpeT [bacterium]|nr:chromophore lyase CpcT/CpeT [bacterium]